MNRFESAHSIHGLESVEPQTKQSECLNADSRRPRIAMISTHGYVAANPPLGAADTGGQVVYVLELSKKLASLGYEADIWTRQFENQPGLEPVSEQVRIIRVPCGGDKFIPKEYLCQSLPMWSENAIRFIKEHGLNYDFINTHYWDAGVAGQQLSDELGVPHIHTPHSLGIWKKRQMENDYPGDAAKFEEQYNFAERIQAERSLYAAADLLVATSPHQLEILHKEYEVPKNSSKVIPPGYDDSRFFPVASKSRSLLRQQLGFSGKIVMAIGRLARNKGYDLLINGFSLVAEREPDANLHLAVGGNNPTSVEENILAELKELVVRLNLVGRVHFGSFIPDEQMADYYRAADLFVLSSRYEPFGMTAIEAMASGTPTVMTVHGGLCQMLSYGETALFADPFDKEDLGITMLKALRHPQLSTRLSRKGSQKTRRLFTWTEIAKQLLTVVEKETPISTRFGKLDVETTEIVRRVTARGPKNPKQQTSGTK